MSEHTLGAGTVLTGRVTNWPMIWLTTALLVPLGLTVRNGPAVTVELDNGRRVEQV
ncbi:MULTISPECIES: hypothetical protein [unclassified Kribbella]|uniref:hypothetical protein n=1 Tax=unclassified Kribbella TaxID=2644121 RepID=UPI0033E6F409